MLFWKKVYKCILKMHKNPVNNWKCLISFPECRKKIFTCFVTFRNYFWIIPTMHEIIRNKKMFNRNFCTKIGKNMKHSTWNLKKRWNPVCILKMTFFVKNVSECMHYGMKETPLRPLLVVSANEFFCPFMFLFVLKSIAYGNKNCNAHILKIEKLVKNFFNKFFKKTWGKYFLTSFSKKVCPCFCSRQEIHIYKLKQIFIYY